MVSVEPIIMKNTSPTMVIALVLIGTVGFLAGRKSSPQSDTSSELPENTRSARASQVGGASDAGEGKSARENASSRPSLTPAERLIRLEEIVRGENVLDRNRALLAFIDQLAPGDYEEAVAHFRSLGINDQRRGEYALLLSAWAKADPLSALTYAKESTNGNFASDTILTSWATLDPDAAMSWAQANHTGEGANPYMVGVIRGLAETDPQRATALLKEMPRSRERADALDAVLPYLFAQGNDATRAWIESLTDESLRNGAMLRSTERLASMDPEGTAKWLLQNPGEAADRRMDNVYTAWVGKNEQAALSSYASLPAGPARTNALQGIVRAVASEDPNKAISLMNNYDSDVNDNVVQNFVWHSFGNHPSAAVSQIARIQNEGQRDRMYSRTLSRWYEMDAAAASAFMQSTPLSESVIRDVNRRINQ